MSLLEMDMLTSQDVMLTSREADVSRSQDLWEGVAECEDDRRKKTVTMQTPTPVNCPERCVDAMRSGQGSKYGGFVPGIVHVDVFFWKPKVPTIELSGFACGSAHVDIMVCG